MRFGSTRFLFEYTVFETQIVRQCAFGGKRIVDLVFGDCIFEEKTGGSKAHLNAYGPHIMGPYETISFSNFTGSKRVAPG